MRKLSLQKKNKQIIFLLFLLVSLPLIIYAVFQIQDIRQRADELPTLYILPNADTVSRNEELILSVIIDTKNEAVNNVSFSLIYPYEKLALKDIDVRTSAFDIQSEYVKGSGIVKVEREATIPVTGEQQVIDIIFTALTETNASEISIPQNAKAISSNNQKDILSNTKLLTAADGEIVQSEETGITVFIDWLMKSLGINKKE